MVPGDGTGPDEFALLGEHAAAVLRAAEEAAARIRRRAEDDAQELISSARDRMEQVLGAVVEHFRAAEADIRTTRPTSEAPVADPGLPPGEDLLAQGPPTNNSDGRA